MYISLQYSFNIINYFINNPLTTIHTIQYIYFGYNMYCTIYSAYDISRIIYRGIKYILPKSKNDSDWILVEDTL